MRTPKVERDVPDVLCRSRPIPGYTLSARGPIKSWADQPSLRGRAPDLASSGNRPLVLLLLIGACVFAYLTLLLVAFPPLAIASGEASLLLALLALPDLTATERRGHGVTRTSLVSSSPDTLHPWLHTEPVKISQEDA